MAASPEDKSVGSYAWKQGLGALLGLLLSIPLLLLLQGLPPFLEGHGIARTWSYAGIAAFGGLLWLTGRRLRRLRIWFTVQGYLLGVYGLFFLFIAVGKASYGSNGGLAAVGLFLVLFLLAAMALDRRKKTRLEALPRDERPPSALAKGGVVETWGGWEIRWKPVVQHRLISIVWVALRRVDPAYHLWIAPRRSSRGLDVSAPLGLRRATAMSNDIEATRRFLDDATLAKLSPYATIHGGLLTVRQGVMEIQLPGSLDDARLRSEARHVTEFLCRQAEETLPSNRTGVASRLESKSPSMKAAQGVLVILSGGLVWVGLMLSVVATIEARATPRVGTAIGLMLFFGPVFSFGLATVLVAGRPRWRYVLPGARSGNWNRSRRRALVASGVGLMGVLLAFFLRLNP